MSCCYGNNKAFKLALLPEMLLQKTNQHVLIRQSDSTVFWFLILISNIPTCCNINCHQEISRLNPNDADVAERRQDYPFLTSGLVSEPRLLRLLILIWFNPYIWNVEIYIFMKVIRLKSSSPDWTSGFIKATHLKLRHHVQNNWMI